MGRALFAFLGLAVTAVVYLLLSPSPSAPEIPEAMAVALKQKPNGWFYNQRAYPFNDIPGDARDRMVRNAQRLRKQTADRRGKAGPQWRNLGPTNVVGRVAALAFKPDGTLFAGAASGGLWRSDDLGASWNPVFDGPLGGAIGDIAVAPSDPNILYMGSGEPNGGGGSLTYPGDGVYKSIDGGVTWFNAGLRKSRHIGRVAVHPTNPDLVYVAAMGNLFSTNSERGVYRTKDGGLTWEQVLYLADDTGAIDLVIDPSNPDRIFTATWERLRQKDNRDYGGINCAVHRSDDGGDTWTRLEGGLPNDEEVGRISVALAPSDPNRVYVAYADNIGFFRALYRSDDGGDTWTQTNDEPLADIFSSFGWWFNQLRVHPTDPDRVFLLGLRVGMTLDGGETWRIYDDIYEERNGGPPPPLEDVHVDNHALVFHPMDPDTIALGNDGGVYLSQDPDVLFVSKPGLPIGQFYTTEINPHNPSEVLGGMQDNGTNSNNADSGGNNWSEIFGGDGMIVTKHPIEPAITYASAQFGTVLELIDYTWTGQAIFNNFNEDRTNWTSPYILDPNDPNTIYFGTFRLYRTEDAQLNNILPITEDLTKGPGEGNRPFNTLTDIDIPTVDSNVIWVGADDGSVQVSEDRGQTWIRVNESLPNRWITSVTAHPLERETAYVTLSGFYDEDLHPHVFRTTDLGRTWTDITANLPDTPVNDLLLFDNFLIIASDIGVFVSPVDTPSWQLLGDGLPLTPISDIDLDLPSQQLTAATYGRGMYVLDLDGVLPLPTIADDYRHVRYLADVSGPNTYVGLVNPNDETAAVVLHAYDRNGDEVAQRSVELPANAMLSRDNLFAEDTDVAWVKVGSDQPVEVYGLSQYAETSAAWRAAQQPSGEVWVPHVAKDTTSFETIVSAVNADPLARTATAQAKPLDVTARLHAHYAPAGQEKQSLQQLFGFDLTAVDYVQLQSDAPALAALETFTSLPNRDMQAILGLSDQVTNRLDFLHIALDTASFWTGIVTLNVGNAAATLSENRYAGDGSLLDSQNDIVLQPGEKRIQVFDQNSIQGVARVSIDADDNAALVGYALFGSPGDNPVRLFAGLGADDRTGGELIWAHISAAGDDWTGLVAVNLGDIPTNLTYTAYDASGQVIAQSEPVFIAAGARRATAVRGLFPDEAMRSRIAWIRGSGDTQNLSGFALIGTGANKLAALEALVR